MDKTSRRSIELILGIVCIGSFALWLIYALQNPSISPKTLFLHYGFFLFISSFLGVLIIQLYNWKHAVDISEDIIYEIVVYRQVTPIKALANKLGLNMDEVYQILMKMIRNNRIIGEIKKDMYYSSSPRKPKCPICNEEIEDSLRLIVCPFCRKPFHKDHLLAYINDIKEECPNCHRILTLGELFAE